MTLNVGEDFTTRWLNTPDAVKTTYIADLERICQLLQSETKLDEWLSTNNEAQKQSEQCINDVYDELKAQRLEEAKQQEQQYRERALEQQRQQEQQQFLALIADEKKRQEQYRPTLNQLKDELLACTTQDTCRSISKPKNSNKKQQQAIESMNILLELEAEELANKLKQVVSEFTQNLHQATQEEIRVSLAQMTQATPHKK